MSINISKLVEDFMFDLPSEDVEEIDIFDTRVQYEGRGGTMLDSFSTVGIVSESYYTSKVFFPHNRDFFLIPSMGEFVFEGETVEEFFFPAVGAEKFSKASFQSIGVASESGILATGNYTDVIDSAREKLDGEEVIVYKVRTRTKEASFLWGPDEHRRLFEVSDPGHYERVNGELFFLSGVNSLKGKEHRWEYLSQGLIDRVRSREGIVVRMSGKEYRLPWNHTATLQVVNCVARDNNSIININCELSDGLYDFVYDAGIGKWAPGKRRRDKVRPDAHGGISEMLLHASTLHDFVEEVPLGLSMNYTPDKIVMVPLSLERKKKIAQGMKLKAVKIRVSGGYKQPDSYRRIILEDWGDSIISTFQVCPRRSNVVSSCGRVSLIKRHFDFRVVQYCGRLYSTFCGVSRGKVKVFHLTKNLEWSINLGGPCLRLYEVENDLLVRLGEWFREHEIGFPVQLSTLDFFIGR